MNNSTYPDNNKVEVAGRIASEMYHSHEVYGEIFKWFKLTVPRLSESSDILIVTVSERLLSLSPLKINDEVFVSGQFRSYNNLSEIGNKLVLTVFAKDIEKISDIREYKTPNTIFLNGFICKAPIYRTTPFGREIADILLAVNRSYNKSDYIPCIAWGRNAKFASTLKIGENIKIWGRVQSREYQKKISEEETENKTAYEVSVSKLEVSNSASDDINDIDNICDEL